MNGTYKDIGKNILTDHSVMVHLPKVELHRHLEGTFDLPVLYAISMRNKLDVPSDFAEFKKFVAFPKDSGPDFLKFLSKFKTDWYRNFKDIEEIVYASIKNLVKDGIFYIELRFNPEHYALYNNFDRKEITRLVVKYGNKAAKETGIHLKYLMTFNRMKQTSQEMIKLYDELRDLNIPEIVGIDLAGDEVNYPPELFTEFFDYVQKDGKFLITIHAGEVSPPQQIWDAIGLLHARRIGHGTSSINDPKLQKELSKQKIVLELCITSNYQTGSWPDESTHPLGRLFRAGVPVTINSDDPHIQDTDLTEDYIKTVRNFNFDLDDLHTINHIALDGSFLGAAERKALKIEYDKAFDEFVNKYCR